MRVEVNRNLLRWARERAGIAVGDLIRRFPQLEEWEPAPKRADAEATREVRKGDLHAVWFLFPSRTPSRARADSRLSDRRQRSPRATESRPARHPLHLPAAAGMVSGLRAFEAEEPYRFVGSASVPTGVEDAATQNAAPSWSFDVEERRRMPTWTEAFRRFIEQADQLGVLVMVSGVVGSNNRRKLDPDEFRGFALSDDPRAACVHQRRRHEGRADVHPGA